MKPVVDFIGGQNSFAVFTHLNPDGDALGSAFSLASALRGLKKRADVLLLAPLPEKYDFPEFRPYLKMLAQADAEEYGACIAVDCADELRLADARAFFFSKPNMNLDHHASNPKYAQVNHVADVAATGEIIFDLMRALNATPDEAARIGIYTAIATDTGNFTFSNTTPRAFEICSQIINMGMDINFVANKIFNERSLGATLLISTFIRNMRLHRDGKLAISVITRNEMEEAGAKPSDCESIINYARDVQTVEIAVFIREVKEGAYKVSFRSKQYADVADFAGRYGGGGHVRAAGCMMKGNIYDILQTVVSVAGEYIR
ncbi:MAG TPA: hypothetical protein DEB31_00790 [Clostridiales bacterium]|nr:hypothetical protein [Clostridiales bacterium]